MVVARLFYEFFKIGLFTYGGGLAMLPLLQEIALAHNWFTEQQFADMIAISQSTPGPIAINMATFVGYNTAGTIGAIFASIGVILPGFIIILIVSKFLSHFNEKPVVKAIFVGLRAAVIGLILTAIVNVAKVSIVDMDQYKVTGELLSLLDVRSLVFFAVSLFAVFRYQKHPIYYIVTAGIIGIIIW